ncbi:MAG: aminopeptidase [Candidatus Competibacterales bacterium]
MRAVGIPGRCRPPLFLAFPLALTSVFALCGLLGGCSSPGYFYQAARGQLALLAHGRPVEGLLAAPDTSADLKGQLATASALRRYASEHLGLPDNDSYRRYVDLGRSFVVKSVFVAPSLSLTPRRWCFPVAGCVSYRGYFDAEAAEAFAASQRAAGYDVYVASVPAYSTLGWFDDPLLNTFVHWPAGQLAELMFHELAHQQLYVAGDTVFNESFATFVGVTGARQWLAAHGGEADRQRYETLERQRRAFTQLVLEAKGQLEVLYQSDGSDAARQRGKGEVLAALQARYQQLRDNQWQGRGLFDRWFARDLNNAKLAAFGAYRRYVDAFAVLFAQEDGHWPRFHQRVATLGALPREARHRQLETLEENWGEERAGDGDAEAAAEKCPPLNATEALWFEGWIARDGLALYTLAGVTPAPQRRLLWRNR